jgi:hypothetical protein
MGGSTAPTGAAGLTPAADTKKVEELKKACDEAYSYAPAANSCSHAVWYVIQKLINPQERLRTANDLIDYMVASKDWREVTVDEGWQLANEGKVVVGGREDTPNGHVIIIYPGGKIPGGGYKYNFTNKRTGKVQQLIMHSHGNYPRCLSRSMGQWPGGVSKGDKNVFDPWGSEEAFKEVRFWTMGKP